MYANYSSWESVFLTETNKLLLAAKERKERFRHPGCKRDKNAVWEWPLCYKWGHILCLKILNFWVGTSICYWMISHIFLFYFRPLDLPFVKLPIESYLTLLLLLLLVLSAKYSNWSSETMFEVLLNESAEDGDGSNYSIVVCEWCSDLVLWLHLAKGAPGEI